MKKKNIFTILIIAICIFSAFSQEKDTINDSTIISNLVDQSNLSELDYYKLLYENSNKNNETYVSLIQWSLGLSFAFLLAIIGSQIFFNYRISKKEIVSIKKDLEERISELKNALSENIETKFVAQNLTIKNDFNKTEKQLINKIKTLNENFSDFKADIKSDFEKTEKQLIDKTETLNENFSDFKADIKSDFEKTEKQLIDKIEILNENFSDFKADIKSDFEKTEKQLIDKAKIQNKNFSDFKADIKSDFEKTEKQLINNLDKQFDSKNELTELQIEVLKVSLLKKIKDIKTEVIENEGHIWELRGVSSNALTSFIDSALIQIELNMEVKYILKYIIKTLTKLKDIHKSDFEKLDSLTEKIKESHKEEFEKIINLYRMKPTYSFEEGVKKIIDNQE
jgi:hypothetical protein